jgi:hypothetical protein
MGLHWSAGRLVRRLLITVAAAACVASLAICWAIQGQYRAGSAARFETAGIRAGSQPRLQGPSLSGMITAS